jgi:hypothetical protein
MKSCKQSIDATLRAMGIQQIPISQNKALLPTFQFNWSQTDSSAWESPVWETGSIWSAANLPLQVVI